jgi:uncharacterized protein (DUF736 family)
MSIIGTFTRDGAGFSGSIETLTLKANITFACAVLQPCVSFRLHSARVNLNKKGKTWQLSIAQNAPR